MSLRTTQALQEYITGSTSTATQQQQQQQAQALINTFNDICVQPCIVWNVAQRLTLYDAAQLAATSLHTARALKGALQQLQCCPTVVIVASGSHRLLQLPLQPSGRPYMQSGFTSTDNVIREVPAKPKRKGKRTPRFTLQQRPNATWLTGIAIGPSLSNNTSAHASNKRALYVCNYAVSGVLKYALGSMRPLGVFASSPELSEPEGIAWMGSTCYVASVGSNSIVALGLDGKLQQQLTLQDGFIPWGMTAFSWIPAGKASLSLAQRHCSSNRASTAAHDVCAPVPIPDDAYGSAFNADGADGPEQHDKACGCCAALFVAVDVEYKTPRYTVPPASTTGGVLSVAVSPSGALLGKAQMYSKVLISRPSGLCFDHAGHLWVTSMEGLLLRLSGPGQASPGILLQTVTLQDILPAHLGDGYLPFDVQTLASHIPIAASTANHHGAVVATAGHNTSASLAGGAFNGACTSRKGSSVLVVTLHKGPRVCGAVAVLHCNEKHDVVQHLDEQDGYREETTTAAAPGGEAVDVHLVNVICGHKALKEPNMVAIL